MQSIATIPSVEQFGQLCKTRVPAYPRHGHVEGRAPAGDLPWPSPLDLDGALGWAYISGYTYGLSVEGVTQNPVNWTKVFNSSNPFLNEKDVTNVSINDAPYGGMVRDTEVYDLMSDALNATGREILYYLDGHPVAGCPSGRPEGGLVAAYYKDTTHMSFNLCIEFDITDSWDNILWHVDSGMWNGRRSISRPGFWNDLDNLMLGGKV